jgi:hypothetical protein
MTPVPPDVMSIFGRALELESVAGRAAYLAEACGDDAKLRAEIEGLLAANGRAGEFMRRPASAVAGGVTASYDPLTEGPGTRVGPYKLLQQIGEGGMGIVYMAEQEQPVRRKVALKIIKPGMDSKAVVARFEAERQALAMMDHAHIARVYDAGTTESGRPFFVMELVHGVPITRYCDDNHLTPKERSSCSGRAFAIRRLLRRTANSAAAAPGDFHAGCDNRSPRSAAASAAYISI